MLGIIQTLSGLTYRVHYVILHGRLTSLELLEFPGRGYIENLLESE